MSEGLMKMNLQRLDNRQYLQEVAQDEEVLINEIRQTQGFILEKMKSNQIFPPLEILMNHINAYTLHFIMDSYQLTLQQSQAVRKFLNHGADEQVLTRQEVEDHLHNNAPLPASTILDLEQIKHLAQPILHYQDYTLISDILKNSFAKLGIEDFLQLEPSFLARNLSAFVTRVDLLADETVDERFKYLYKTVVCLADERASIRLQLLKNWPFTQQDRDFLTELLSNCPKYHIPSYSEVAQIKGFTQLFSKEEFFTRFNHENIEQFSDEEVRQNKHFFQEVWHRKNEKLQYHLLNYFLDYECSLEQFITIMDREFVGKLLQEAKTDAFLYENKNHSNKLFVRKQDYLHCVSLDIIANSPVDTSIKLYTLGHLANTVHHYEDSVGIYSPQINQANIAKVFANIVPHYLHNHHLEDLCDQFKEVFKPELIDHFLEMFSRNNHVNSLHALCLVYKRYHETSLYGHDQKAILKKMEEGIEKAFDSLAHPDAPLIVDYFSCSEGSHAPFFEKLKTSQRNEAREQRSINTQAPTNQDPYNFLHYEADKLHEVSLARLQLIRQFKPGILNDILQQGFEPPVSFIKDCLKECHKENIFSFLKEYVALKRPSIEKDEKLLQAFLSNPRQREIFPTLNQASEQEAFDQMVEIIKRQASCQQRIDEVVSCFLARFKEDDYIPDNESQLKEFSHKWFGSSGEQLAIQMNPQLHPASAGTLDLAIEHVALNQEVSSLDEQYRTLYKTIGAGFIKDKVVELMRDNEFDILFTLYGKRGYQQYKQLIVDEINSMDFERFYSLLQQPRFSKFIVDNMSHDAQSPIQLHSFSHEQNFRVACFLKEQMYQYAKDSGEFQKNEYIDLTRKIFSVFAPENRAFTNEFCVQHFPREIFFNSWLSMEAKTSYKPRHLVQRSYTFEEILQAWQRVEKIGGIMGYKDINAEYTSFFSTNLFPVAKDLTCYMEFIDFAKQHSAKLYTLASHAEIFRHSLEYGKAKPMDEASNEFFAQHFDLDTIMEGLKGFMQDAASQKIHGVNKRVVEKINFGVLHRCYYDIYAKHVPVGYDSYLKEEDSLKVFKLFYEHAPLYLFALNRVGGATPVEDFIQKHVEHLSCAQMVKGFIFPHVNLAPVDFAFDRNSDANQQRLKSIIAPVIEHATIHGQSQVIDMLAYFVKQQQFMDKEVKSGQGLTQNRLYNSTILRMMANSAEISTLLSNSEVNIKLHKVLYEAPDQNFYTKKRRKI